MFKIGDKVRCISKSGRWLGHTSNINVGDVFTVTHISGGNTWIRIGEKYDNGYYLEPDCFELIERKEEQELIRVTPDNVYVGMIVSHCTEKSYGKGKITDYEFLDYVGDEVWVNVKWENSDDENHKINKDAMSDFLYTTKDQLKTEWIEITDYKQLLDKHGWEFTGDLYFAYYDHPEATGVTGEVQIDSVKQIYLCNNTQSGANVHPDKSKFKYGWKISSNDDFKNLKVRKVMNTTEKTYSVNESFIKEAYKAACSEWKKKLENKFPEIFKTKLTRKEIAEKFGIDEHLLVIE